MSDARATSEPSRSVRRARRTDAVGPPSKRHRGPSPSTTASASAPKEHDAGSFAVALPVELWLLVMAYGCVLDHARLQTVLVGEERTTGRSRWPSDQEGWMDRFERVIRDELGRLDLWARESSPSGTEASERLCDLLWRSKAVVVGGFLLRVALGQSVAEWATVWHFPTNADILISNFQDHHEIRPCLWTDCFERHPGRSTKSAAPYRFAKVCTLQSIASGATDPNGTVDVNLFRVAMPAGPTCYSRLRTHVLDVVRHFDLAFCQVAFDGRRVHVLDRMAFLTQTSTVRRCHESTSAPDHVHFRALHRVAKYQRRGFHVPNVVLPDTLRLPIERVVQLHPPPERGHGYLQSKDAVFYRLAHAHHRTRGEFEALHELQRDQVCHLRFVQTFEDGTVVEYPEGYLSLY